MKENPLVSVVVVTYNSAQYIIETLESIYNQSYKNIELIIADDCSTDDTEVVCVDWLKKNAGRFVNSVFTKTVRNSGVSANLNNGISKSSGEFIKSIAGDDILLEDCIATNLQFFHRHPSTEMAFSRCRPFGTNEVLKKSKDVFRYSYFSLSNRAFKYHILRSNFVPASTKFTRRSVFDKIGNYNEDIPLLEDWPFLIKAVCNNVNIKFIDEDTVRYRMHESSLSNATVRSERYMRSEKLAKDFALEYQRRVNKLLWFNTIASNKYTNCNNVFAKLFWALLIMINPLTYYLKYTIFKLKK